MQYINYMFSRLLFLFIFIPVAELYLLIMVGARIGFLPTIGLIVFTGILGASLARQQGLSTLAKIQSELADNRIDCLYGDFRGITRPATGPFHFSQNPE